MEPSMPHPVVRVDDTLNRANPHERAEAVAVPDSNDLERVLAGFNDAIVWPN